MWCWRTFRLLNCKSRKKLVNKLVEKYSKNIDEKELIYNETLDDYENCIQSLYNM